MAYGSNCQTLGNLSGIWSESERSEVLARIWGKGIKIIVEPSEGLAVVFVHVGPGRFSSASGSFACAVDTGLVDEHQLTEAQLNWLQEQEEEVAKRLGIES